MLCHLALSSSSLIFQVLPKRIHKKPSIIWKEYQLHAIVFTMRCVSFFLYATYVPRQYRNWVVQLVLVLAHHIVADVVTEMYGKEGETTVRGRHHKSLKVRIRWLTRLYAVYQLAALGSHIAPNEERMADLAFNGLVAIQSSAFLMTLYRKALIEWYHHAIVYSACLLLSLAYMLQSFPLVWFWAGIRSRRRVAHPLWQE